VTKAVAENAQALLETVSFEALPTIRKQDGRIGSCAVGERPGRDLLEVAQATAGCEDGSD
jgi:hypothetical protein